MNEFKPANDYKLTRGVKELIEQAIAQSNGSNNRNTLCEVIARTVEERYAGLNLDYQLNRMRIETTGAILNAIDTYFFKHKKNLD